MTFSILPNEMQDYIVNISSPTHYFKREDVKTYLKNTSNTSQVSRHLYQICKPHLEKIKRIHELIGKYHYYQARFENPSKCTNCKLDGNPQLIDIILSGSSLDERFQVKASQKKFDIQDFRDVIKYIPKSLNVNMKTKYFTLDPLAAALLNFKNIDWEVFETLAKNGADLQKKSHTGKSYYDCLKKLQNQLNHSNNICLFESKKNKFMQNKDIERLFELFEKKH